MHADRRLGFAVSTQTFEVTSPNEVDRTFCTFSRRVPRRGRAGFFAYDYQGGRAGSFETKQAKAARNGRLLLNVGR